MMPGIDGFEVCERLKANASTAHIPVVMVTALDQPSDRVRGLKAGADDFLTKPVNDLQLMSRVKSLVRLKKVSDELRLRAETAPDDRPATISRRGDGRAGRVRPILLVDGRGNSQERIIEALKPIAEVTAMSDPQAALVRGGRKRVRSRHRQLEFRRLRSAAALLAAALAGAHALSSRS